MSIDLTDQAVALDNSWNRLVNMIERGLKELEATRALVKVLRSELDAARAEAERLRAPAPDVEAVRFEPDDILVTNEYGTEFVVIGRLTAVVPCGLHRAQSARRQVALVVQPPGTHRDDIIRALAGTP